MPPLDITSENPYSLRPQSLNSFIGQSAAKENLRIRIEAAKRRDQAIEHVLLVGPPGLGKTTLAKIIANEIGSDYKSAVGPSVVKLEMATLLTNLSDKDVFFIDEIHRMAPVVQESLYPAMEDYKLDLPLGQGTTGDIIPVPLAHFTLVGATTREGLLAAPFRDRFGIRIHLDYYSVEELMIAIQRNSEQLQVSVDEDAQIEIGQRSRGTMRIAKNLLLSVRDFAIVRYDGKIDGSIAREALEFFQIDELGLNEQDRLYLETLIERFKGGRAGLRALAAALNEDERTIEEVYEPYLIKIGLISLTPHGRTAMGPAYSHLGYPLPDLLYN